MTERDLLRQIASNLTKEEIQRTNQSPENAKVHFTEHLQSCNKVWQSFEKFIFDQVCKKNRMVDTQLCGIFFKINSQASVQFLPSPDYLEAGKFKISRHAKMVDTQNLNLNKLYYRESYDQLLAVSDYYTLFDRPSECLGYKKK